MPQARDHGRTRAKKPTPASAFALPALPPKTEQELKQDRELLAMLQDTTAVLRQRNLDNAVILAEQAAAGYGPLVEHFAELGRRYAHLLDAQPKPVLRVIKGGVA